MTKTYKKDKDGDKTNTIVKKRDLHKSISSHMILANDTILKILYENVFDYSNFANLYYAALEVYNQSIIERSEISIDGVDTYGLGRWIKFEGKVSDEKEYIENSKKLASLVSGTPWCTKTLASSQLAEGDFYVFVDHQDKPHIAVKMRRNEIDEVRGIENGNAQELEDEYRCAALSFLEKNKDIQNGREWLEKEEWNKRLIHYNTLIENGTLSQDMIPNLIDDYFKRDYRSHGSGNTNKEKLSNNLSRVIDKLADYYECREEEICLGDYDGNYKEIDGVKTCSYKIIFGNADFRYSEITSLGQLQSIGGYAYFKYSYIIDLGQLQSIGGDAYFGDSNITDLGQLQSIGGDAYFRDSKIISLGQLQSIGGNVSFIDSSITDLGQIQSIGGNAYFGRSKVTSLGQLQSIRGYADFGDSNITDLGQLESIGGDAYFRDSKITNLGQLQSIGGNVSFIDSSITDLGQLQSIGGNAYFRDSEIIDLGQLQSIGRDANFVNSKIINLGQIQYIGGLVSFNTEEQRNIYEQEFVDGKRINSQNKRNR